MSQLQRRAVDVEQVYAASDRIARVLDELRLEGIDPGLLHIALVDANVRLGRFYSPSTSTVTLLHRLSELVISMERDEQEDEARKAQENEASAEKH